MFKTARAAAAEDVAAARAQAAGLPEPPDGALVLHRGEWNDLPAPKLLETLAYDNCANWTGELDWHAGAEPLGGGLIAYTNGFCDNFVLKCLVPPEQVILGREGDRRSQKYVLFGPRCAKIREIVAASRITITPDAVTGARLFAVADAAGNAKRIPPPCDISADTVPGRGANAPPVADGAWFWQHFKIACPDVDMQAVINMLRSGVFAQHGLWLNDFDVTIDCKGGVRCHKLKNHLVRKCGFRLEGQEDSEDSDSEEDEGGRSTTRTILQNEHKVGRNCITWLQTSERGQHRLRVKLYAKLVQEFEKHSVRTTVGQHIGDWIEMRDTLLASARNATADTGLMRAETTLYVDGPDIHIAQAHKHIPQSAAEMTRFAELQIAVVPESFVLKAPHSLMVANWAANIKQTLVVVDQFYNVGLVVYAKNELTMTVSGTMVKSWRRRSQYVLQKLTLGDHPVDVIYLNRGSKHEAVEQQLPGTATKRDAAAAGAVQQRRGKKNSHLWVDRDADFKDDGQLTIQQALTAGLKRAHDSESASSGDDDDAEPEESASESESEAEPELDTDAQVHAQVEAARKQWEAEVASAQAAANADSTSSIGADDAVEWACSPGDLVVVGQRLHRVPVSADSSNVTEFPPSGGLEHHFRLPGDMMPLLPPLRAEPKTAPQRAMNAELTASNKEFLAMAARDVVGAMVITAGFSPLASMNTIVVHPRVTDAPISNKIKYAHLVVASPRMEVDVNSLLAAKRFASFKITAATRKTRKLKQLKQRQKTRIAGLAEAAAERATVVSQKEKTNAALELKRSLRAAYESRKPQALRSLAPGSYPVVAVRIDTKACELFLLCDGKTVPYTTLSAVDAAVKDKALQLAPFHCALGHESHSLGVYYLDPELNCSPIGSLTKVACTLREASGRARVDCGLVIGETVVHQTLAEQREAHAGQAGAEAEELSAVADEAPSGAILPSTVPPLLLSADEQRGSNTPYLAKQFNMTHGTTKPRVVRVLKMVTARNVAQEDSVWLQVAEDHAFAGGNAAPVVVRGGPTLNEKVGELTADCRIIVYKCLAKHAINCKIVAAADFSWINRLPLSYNNIPALRKGEQPNQPRTINIAASGSVPVRGSNLPVIIGADGRQWRFAAPQNIKPNAAKRQPGLALQVGAVLDTKNFTVAPGTGGV